MFREYQPCLPTRAMKAPSGQLWIHEIRHDGFRIIARKVGGVVRLQTKQGYDYAKRYPRIVDALMRLKATSIVLDGEAMCFTGVKHDFDKLWNRIHDYEATLCAFDLLALDGEDYRARPLLERKRRLFKLLKRHPAGVEYVEHFAWPYRRSRHSQPDAHRRSHPTLGSWWPISSGHHRVA